jgi:hypothetical protein
MYVNRSFYNWITSKISQSTEISLTKFPHNFIELWHNFTKPLHKTKNNTKTIMPTQGQNKIVGMCLKMFHSKSTEYLYSQAHTTKEIKCKENIAI